MSTQLTYTTSYVAQCISESPNTAMPSVETFQPEALRAICNVLGETEYGLTGGEIGRFLEELGIEDPTPGEAKCRRLYNALKKRQSKDKSGSHVVAFIHKVMNPALYAKEREYYNFFRKELNVALAFSGLNLRENGKLRRGKKAKTLNEAEKRASDLQSELKSRGVHPDVLKFCRAELLEKNYFHAVFEVTKSVADKIRDKAGLTTDGAPLVDQAFALGKSGVPILAVNSLETETEQSEQKGFANLLKGLFGTFRNTTAHAPRIHWEMEEQDALDLFSLASLCHRRIDAAVNVQRLYQSGAT